VKLEAGGDEWVVGGKEEVEEARMIVWDEKKAGERGGRVAEILKVVGGGVVVLRGRSSSIG